MEKKNRKYFVLSAEEGDIDILSVHDNYAKACERLKIELYAYRDKIIETGRYDHEDIRTEINYDCVAPYGEISIPNNIGVCFVVKKFDI